MNYLKTFTLLFLVSTSVILKAQNNDEPKIEPYINLGGGLIDDLMQQGKVLSGEIGFKNERGYTYSINVNFGEAFRDNMTSNEINNAIFDFIDTYKSVNLFCGYEFSTNNGKHLFTPKLGLFWSESLIVSARVQNGQLETYRTGWQDIGFGCGASYLFKTGDHFTIGVSSHCNFSVEIGFLHYVVTPTVGLRF